MTQEEAERLLKPLIGATVEKLSEVFSDEEILGVNIVYLSVKHDGTEDHDDCKMVSRHTGALKLPTPELKREMVNAMVRSTTLLSRNVSMEDLLNDPSLDGKKGN